MDRNITPAKDAPRVSPYLRYFLAPAPARSRGGVFLRCCRKLHRVFRTGVWTVLLGIPSIVVLLSYATLLCFTRRRRTNHTQLLCLFRHFFSCEAYTCSPFFMYVNAYLHTSCAQFMRSLSPIDQPSVELGAGDGSFSEAALAGTHLSILSSVVPSDAVHLQKRAIAHQVAIVDAEYLPFGGESIRFIFMIDGLYHVANQEQAIQELARVLAPGGTVAFNYPVEDFFRRCFPLQRLFASVRLESLRRRDLDRLKHQHFVDELFSPSALRGLLAENGLEVIGGCPFASGRAMRLAYLLYWLGRHAEGRILDSVVRLRVVRKVLDTLRDEVFYPLLMRDSEDCRETGGTYVWWIARKRGETGKEVGPLTYVCPICKRGFVGGAYSCSACGRTFPVADDTPIFLVHGHER